MSEVIGYIGVGDMGGPMARNLLQQGFAVVAYDIQPDRLAAIEGAGATAAASARDVAVQAKVFKINNIFRTLNIKSVLIHLR